VTTPRFIAVNFVLLPLGVLLAPFGIGFDIFDATHRWMRERGIQPFWTRFTKCVVLSAIAATSGLLFALLGALVRPPAVGMVLSGLLLVLVGLTEPWGRLWAWVDQRNP
jgi:hypothetical protein